MVMTNIVATFLKKIPTNAPVVYIFFSVSSNLHVSVVSLDIKE